MKKPLCLLLAAYLAFGLGAGVSAAEPSLSGESNAMAGVTFTGFQPLESGNGRIRWDLAVCSIRPKLVDDSGQVWQVADTTPLLDSSLFSQRSSIPVGPELVRKVSLSAGEEGALTAQVFLEQAYSGEQTALVLHLQWTARQDCSLPVTGKTGDSTLEVAKGAVLQAECRLVLNQESTQVAAYPGQIPPLETDRWRGIPALEALHAAEGEE